MGAQRFTQNSDAWMRWLFRFGVAAAVIAGLSALPYRRVAPNGSEKLEAMHQELARTQAEISRSEADIVIRRRHVEALKRDTLTIERIARQDLHMLYPHEKMLRLGNGAKHVEGGQ